LVEAACHGRLGRMGVGAGVRSGSPAADSGAGSSGVHCDLYSTCVVMASPGYPGPHRTGIPISIPDPLPEGVVVFHAGTALDGDRLVSAGGRVLGVVGVASGAAKSRQLTYDAVGCIGFEGAHYRRDIGAI
jgi:phosphoribosylamine--glycine ligase